MSLLYDRIIAKGELEKNVEIGLRKSIKIEASNVARYLYLSEEKEYWDMTKDFPNVAPPFREYFIEYRIPSIINSSEFGIKKKHPLMEDYVGFLFSAVKKEEFKNYFEFIDIDDIGGWGKIKNQIEINDLIKWIVCGIMFLEKKKYNPIPISVFNFGIKEDGIVARCVPYSEEKTFFLGSIYEAERIRKTMRPEEFNQVMRDAVETTGSRLSVPLLATSFMHCKNTELMTNAPNLGMSKKFKKNHGEFLVEYKTIKIEPMKKILKSEGKSEKVGLKKALHICRGHFRDYRERGLFGTTRGVFWFDQHWRGDPKIGIIQKDYQINSPN